MVVIYVPEDKRWEQLGKGAGTLLGTWMQGRIVSNISQDISKMSDDPQYTNNPTKLRNDIQAKYGPMGTQLYDKSLDAQAKQAKLEAEKLQPAHIRAETANLLSQAADRAGLSDLKKQELKARIDELLTTTAERKVETQAKEAGLPYVGPEKAASYEEKRAAAEKHRQEADLARTQREQYERDYGQPGGTVAPATVTPPTPGVSTPQAPTGAIEPPNAPTTPGPPAPTVMPSLQPPQVTSPPGGAPAPTGPASGPAGVPVPPIPPTPPAPAPTPIMGPGLTPGGGARPPSPAPALPQPQVRPLPTPPTAPPAGAPAPGATPPAPPTAPAPAPAGTEPPTAAPGTAPAAAPAAAPSTPIQVPQAYSNNLTAMGITDPGEQLRVFLAGQRAGPKGAATAARTEIDKVLQEHATAGRQEKTLSEEQRRHEESLAAAAKRQKESEAAAAARQEKTLGKPELLPTPYRAKLPQDAELVASLEPFLKEGAPTGGVLAKWKQWMTGKGLENDPEYMRIRTDSEQAIASYAVSGGGFGGHWRTQLAEMVTPGTSHYNYTNVLMTGAIAERQMRYWASAYNELKGIPGQQHNLEEISRVYGQYKALYDQADKLWWGRERARDGTLTGPYHYYYEGREVDRNLRPVVGGAGTILPEGQVYRHKPSGGTATGSQLNEQARLQGKIPNQMLGPDWEKVGG